MSRFIMRRLNFLIALLVASAATTIGLFSAAPALASSSQVVSDCNANGHLTGHYSRGDLQGALNGMGADTQEYTSCSDVIRRALLASAASGGRSGPGSASGAGQGGSQATRSPGSGAGSAGVSTSGVYSKVPNALSAGGGSGSAVALGGSSIRPGSAGVDTSSGVRSLPAPLIGVLVLLALAALGGGWIALRRRVVARHGG